MSASIILSSLALASDGKTLTATLSGGSGSGYAITNQTGLTCRKTNAGALIYQIASVGVSGTTLTINLSFPFASTDTVVLDVGGSNTITDSGANTGTTATGSSVTNNSTATVTAFASSNSAFKFRGRWTSALVSGHVEMTPNYDSQFTVRVTGTDVAVVTKPVATAVSKSAINAGSYGSMTATQTSTWEAVPAVSGHADSAFDLEVKSIGTAMVVDDGTGASTGGTILVAGSAPALASPSTIFGTVYPLSADPFLTYGKIDGGADFFSQAGYINMAILQGGGEGFRFQSNSSFIALWHQRTNSPGEKYLILQNGVEVGTFTATAIPSGFLFGRSVLISGLDTSTSYTYEVVVIGGPSHNDGNPSINFFLELDGNGVEPVTQPARTLEAFFGDSITYMGLGISDARDGDPWIAVKDQLDHAIVVLGDGSKAIAWARDHTSEIPTSTNRVWCRYGHNDFGGTIGAVGTPDTIKGDYYTMLQNIRSRIGASKWIICEHVFPATGIDYSTINAGISDVVATYVSNTSDAFIKVVTTAGWIDPTIDTIDANHPNASGYAKIANREIPLAAASGVLITGTPSGTAGSASSAVTVTLAGGATFTGDQTVTLTSSNTGDTLTPSVGSPGTTTVTVTPSSGATSFTYTVTRSTSGTSTITYTNGQVWDDPATTGIVFSDSDTTPPTVTAASINTDGDTLAVTFSESVTGGTGFTLSGGATLGSAIGSGSSRTFSISPTVKQGQTRTLSYVPGDIADDADNAMEAFSGADVTNDSTVVAATLSASSGAGAAVLLLLLKR